MDKHRTHIALMPSTDWQKGSVSLSSCKKQTSVWTPSQNHTKINYTVQALRKKMEISQIYRRRGRWKGTMLGAWVADRKQAQQLQGMTAMVLAQPSPLSDYWVAVTVLYPIYSALSQHGWVQLLRKLISFLRRLYISEVYLFIRVIYAPKSRNLLQHPLVLSVLSTNLCYLPQLVITTSCSLGTATW